MMWFILLGFITFISLVIWYVGVTYADYNGNWFERFLDKWEDFTSFIPSISIFIISIGILPIMWFSTVNLDAKFRQIETEYYFTKDLLESYNGEEYGNVSSLTEKVISINETISKHNAYYNSKWNSVWYSEKIGKLKPLTFSNKDK